MVQIIIIDVLVVAVLVFVTMTKGLERALPFFVFVLVLCPNESQIAIPGIFDLTTWRVAITTVTVLFFLFKGPALEAQPILKNTPLRFLIALHILWCLLSTANSISPVDSIKQVLTFAIEYYLLYFIALHSITRMETVHRILAAMVAAVAIACIFGWVEAYYTWRVTDWFPSVGHYFGAEYDDGRMRSTFSNYSLFGAAIAFAIVEVFYFLHITARGSKRFILWLTLILMFWVVYKTTTRGPWIAAIIGGILLLLYSSRGTRLSLAAITCLCVAVFVIRPGVWDTVRDLYVQTVNDNDPNSVKEASYEYRWALWTVGANAINKNASRELLGFGMGTFFQLHLVAPFNGNPNYVFTSCDEAWVQQMVETGYVGLGIVALVLLTPLYLTLRNLRRIPKQHRYLCWVLFINIVQYYFMMTNVDIYGWGQTGYMLWIWIAISMVYPALADREYQASKPLQMAKAEPELARWEPAAVAGAPRA